MNNQTLVYELAAKYISSSAGDNGNFDYFRNHLVSDLHSSGISFYKVGQYGGAEYYLGCSNRGTLYKRVVRRSYRIHMDLYEYHKLLNSDNSVDEQKAFESEEELISEEIIPLMYSTQIGFIGQNNERKSYL